MLVYNSVRGNASTSDLKRIGESASLKGMPTAEKQVPQDAQVKNSNIRTEPRRNGVRIEVTLHNDDAFDTVVAKGKAMAKKMKLVLKNT